jgi:hypothetical protein
MKLPRLYFLRSSLIDVSLRDRTSSAEFRPFPLRQQTSRNSSNAGVIFSNIEVRTHFSPKKWKEHDHRLAFTSELSKYVAYLCIFSLVFRSTAPYDKVNSEYLNANVFVDFNGGVQDRLSNSSASSLPREEIYPSLFFSVDLELSALDDLLIYMPAGPVSSSFCLCFSYFANQHWWKKHKAIGRRRGPNSTTYWII